MSVPTLPRPRVDGPAWRRLGRFLPWVPLGVALWLSLGRGRVPASLSPTVPRTLYLKLPIAGTRFHWQFVDRQAVLAGELTLRIVNVKGGHEQTLVIFRDGTISDGWAMIGEMPRDSSVYFGFETARRFPTTVGDSLVLTLRAVEDLRGRGPYSQGTLPKGTYVATGTYSGLYGGTMNPVNDLVAVGSPPAAYLECWDMVWPLRNARNVGWMGPKPTDEDSRFPAAHGVDGRQCRSTL